MKKLLFVFCIFCCIQMNVSPQSIYSVGLKKDLIIGTLSLGIGIGPFFIDNKPENTPGILDRNEVNAFDRSLMFPHNKPLDIISDNVPFALALLPVISIIPNIKHKNTLLTYSIMYSESLLLTYGTVFSLKNSIIRYRPYMYADGIPDGKEKDYYNSFPSSATAFAFLSATFLSTTFSCEFPESKWKIPVIAGSYALAAGIGAARILTGAHFLTDVLAGAAAGSLYGWLIPRLHLRNDNKDIRIIPTGNGMMVSFSR
ncbi:MAG: phosphatase PAP2 family protein [Treponema sp.]|jgi:membrane-associated phospholipid phosphatase|nr:phosphatase PAP2 family protein [Treponema sp.]